MALHAYGPTPPREEYHPHHTREATCEHCGRVFLARQPRRFCGGACDSRYRRGLPGRPDPHVESELRLWLRVTTPCPVCGVRGATGYLAGHLREDHGVGA